MVKKFILFFILLGVVNCNAQGKWYDLDGSLGCNSANCQYWQTAYAICPDTVNNVLYVGGEFNLAGGISQNGLSKWNGTSWVTVPDNGFKSVDALIMYNGSLYVGQTYASGAWRFDGSNWYTLPKLNGNVACFCVYEDTLYAGGSFNYGDSTTLNCIAKWSGSKWLPLGKGVYGSCCPEVFALTVYNNQLIAGGYYTNAGNISTPGIASWNGSDWAPLGCCINNYNGPPGIFSLEVFKGKLFVGGIDSVNNFLAYGIASWDGSNWDTIPGKPGIGGKALKSFNGYLFMDGNSNPLDSYLGKYDGVSVTTVDSGVNASVYSLAALNGSLYVGGEFDTVGSTLPAKGIARWMPNSAGINQMTSSNNELSIYPNPFSQQTTLQFSQPTAANAKLTIFDLTGREVGNYFIASGTKSLTIKRNNLPAGMYFYRLACNSAHILTGKIVAE